MSNENDKSGSLEAMERTLAGFRPAPPRIERDRLMFLAGRASAEGTEYSSVLSTECLRPAYDPTTAHTDLRRRNWFWPASTAALAATSLALAMATVLRPEPSETIVYRDVPTTAIAAAPQEAVASVEIVHVAAVATSGPAVSRVPAENYLRTREVAVRMGLDAIGSQQTVPGLSSPPTYGELLWGLMGSRQPSDGGTERRENLFNM